MEGILRLKFWLAAALVALFGFGLLVVSVVQAAQNRSAKAGIARDLEKVSTSMKNPIHNSKWANQLREHEASYREQLKAVTADLQKQGKLLKRPFADPRPDAFGFLEIYPGKVKELKERLADSVYESDPRALRDRGQEFFRSQEYPEDSEMRKAEQEYWIQEAIVSAVERTNDGPEDKILGFRRLTLNLRSQTVGCHDVDDLFGCLHELDEQIELDVRSRRNASEGSVGVDKVVIRARLVEKDDPIIRFLVVH